MWINNLLYFCVSLLVSLALVKACIWFSAKHGLFDTVDERKIHTGEIGRLGGFGFIVPFIVLGLGCFILGAVKGEASFEDYSLWGLFVGVVIIYISGTTDDIKNLKPYVKLGLQIFAGLASMGFFVVAFKDYSFSVLNVSIKSVLILLASFIFYLGCVNSYNLIDGSDLLCSSLSIYSIFTLGFILKEYSSVYFTIAVIFCGGLAGFMFFNKPDAKVFMGDGGSQSIGAVVSFFCLLVLARSEGTLLSHLICMNLVSIPCIDCIAAIWRRIRQKVGIFHADKFHMHHKLLAMGFKKRGIAILANVIQILISVSALISWIMKDRYYWGCVIFQFIVFAGILVYFSILHFKSHAVVDVK